LQAAKKFNLCEKEKKQLHKQPGERETTINLCGAAVSEQQKEEKIMQALVSQRAQAAVENNNNNQPV